MIDQPQVKQHPVNRTLIMTGNCLLMLIAVYCTFGALLSSFSISVTMISLFWVWLISAVVLSAVAMIYGGKGILISAIPVFLLFLMSRGEIIEGAMYVIYTITDHYANWLPVTVFFPESAFYREEPLIFISAAGIVVSLLLAYTVCVRRSIFCTILSTAPIVFLTFVITDLQSDVVYLLGLIAVYLTLLISSAFSPDDFFKRGMKFFPSLVISLMIMVLAYWVTPYTNYVRENYVADFSNRFRVIASQMGRFGQLFRGSSGISYEWLETRGGIIWQFNTDYVNIAGAGGRTITNQSLLEVDVDRTGIFYIRGYSMQYFDGRSWLYSDESFANHDAEIATAIRSEIFGNTTNDFTFPLIDIARTMPEFIAVEYYTDNPESLVHSANMRITRTGDLTAGVTYQPYYSTAVFNDVERFADTEMFKYVEGSVLDLAGALYLQRLNSQYRLNNFVTDTGLRSRYTQIDESTARELRQMAVDAGIDINADRAAITDAVANYIQSAGRYTLIPEAVPDDVDFSLYFLQTLKEGYCIHFATAAVMMLRSLDIPARFTSGYVVTVPEYGLGRTVVLTDRNAHAWVEVFYEGVGWLYLEVTPSSAFSAIPDGMPHTPDYYPDYTDFLPPDLSDMEGMSPEDMYAGAGAGGQTARRFPAWMTNLGAIVVFIILIIVALPVRRNLMFKHREKQFNQSNANAAVIWIWKYIAKISRGEAVPPADIEELALKARFSQHRINEEEREIMIKFAKRLAYEIYNGKEDPGRFWLSYIRALY